MRQASRLSGVSYGPIKGVQPFSIHPSNVAERRPVVFIMLAATGTLFFRACRLYKSVCSLFSLGSVTSSQGLLLVRSCGSFLREESPEQRTQLVDRVWSTLQELSEYKRRARRPHIARPQVYLSQVLRNFGEAVYLSKS